MEQVSPTRTELLSKRAQTRLAQQGAKLLRGKREALVREFLSEVSSLKSEREEMLKSLSESIQLLMRTLMIDGTEAVLATSFAAPSKIDVEIVERNIWGTKVVDVEQRERDIPTGGEGRSPASNSVRIDDTAESFDKAVRDIIRVAPRLHKLRRLAEEIRKTTRRVNALEQRLLPALGEQVRYIRGVLDQREREDIFRLKRIKGNDARQKRRTSKEN